MTFNWFQMLFRVFCIVSVQDLYALEQFQSTRQQQQLRETQVEIDLDTRCWSSFKLHTSVDFLFIRFTREVLGSRGLDCGRRLMLWWWTKWANDRLWKEINFNDISKTARTFFVTQLKHESPWLSHTQYTWSSLFCSRWVLNWISSRADDGSSTISRCGIDATLTYHMYFILYQLLILHAHIRGKNLGISSSICLRSIENDFVRLMLVGIFVD